MCDGNALDLTLLLKLLILQLLLILPCKKFSSSSSSSSSTCSGSSSGAFVVTFSKRGYTCLRDKATSNHIVVVLLVVGSCR